MNTIAIALICIWTGAMFWSGAPLLGWGSYTGLFSDTNPTWTCILQASIWTLCLMFFRSRLWHLWGGLVQSQLLHHPQVLHHLYPHLLLFHPCDDHALCLRLHHQHSEKHQRHVSWWLPHHPSEEGGERCHEGRQKDKKVVSEVFYWKRLDLRCKMRLYKALLESARSVINLLSRYFTPDNCYLMFRSRFPLWSARLSSWPGRHMQWYLCGQPGAFTCQAQPASSPASLPSLPASTTRSSTSAWAPSFARTCLCCCRAPGSARKWCVCSILKTSNPRRRPHPHLHHFLSRSWWQNTPQESWTKPILTVTQGSTALLRLLHSTRRRCSTLTCPPTLKHQSTGVTGSDELLSKMWINYFLNLRWDLKPVHFQSLFFLNKYALWYVNVVVRHCGYLWYV